MIKLLSILLLAIALVACNNQPAENKGIDNENPNAKEILSENKDADIFVLNGIVYTNAENIEWVNEKNLTVDEPVGEVKKRTDDINKFENLTATKLEVGTKIYKPIESVDIYIVKIGNKEIRYLGLKEG